MKTRKLGRDTGERRALFRDLVTALIRHERIHTTEAKAKEAKKVADKLIALAQEGTLHARRQAARLVQDRDALRKLFTTIAPRYARNRGGYTRIVKDAPRRGDAAPMAYLELVKD
ncbi:MAG: 50S ribosomal protein L17 [Armatimonadota bacterium]|nr:50S ribosomal protein L17 [Armatimonadota bacterium]MDW8156757.1 50S ribosomal protein L17 [Armatimonadota bacterium]